MPTIALSHLSETERRAYVLADNKLALNAGCDKEVLAIELQALVNLDEESETAITLCELVRRRPSVVTDKVTRIEDSTPRRVAALLGLDLETAEVDQLDLLIVGGRPAGVAAAVYAGLRPQGTGD